MNELLNPTNVNYLVASCSHTKMEALRYYKKKKVRYYRVDSRDRIETDNKNNKTVRINETE